MLILAYNFSPQIDTNLRKVERLKEKIMLSPLSPRDELKYRWEATIDKTYWSLSLTNTPLTRKEMEVLLSKLNRKRLTDFEKLVIGYKEALDYIKNNWSMTSKAVDLELIQTLHKISEPSPGGIQDRTNLKLMLDYLLKSDEHAVLQAGIAQIQIINIAPFSDGNGRLARLLPYVYLHKAGYDCRGLFSVDEYFRRDIMTLKSSIETVTASQNLTAWLEYYTRAVAKSLENAYKKIKDPKSSTYLSDNFFRLNKRQRKIVDYLDSPTARITNSDLQDTFKISQITAARDLTKLANIGVLLKHGGGRSTYYTKA